MAETEERWDKFLERSVLIRYLKWDKNAWIVEDTETGLLGLLDKGEIVLPCICQSIDNASLMKFRSVFIDGEEYVFNEEFKPLESIGENVNEHIKAAIIRNQNEYRWNKKKHLYIKEEPIFVTDDISQMPFQVVEQLSLFDDQNTGNGDEK